MLQFCNPIKGKLNKMKQSFTRRNHTMAEETPIKANPKDEDKENQELTFFDRTLTNNNSLRKLDLLSKKTSRKQDSITFYRKELTRRKHKYERELLEA